MCRALEDRGVAIYFTYDGSEHCIPRDKWRTIRENMRAIADHREPSLRWTVGNAKEVVNAAFFGSKALPRRRCRLRQWPTHLAWQRGLVGGAGVSASTRRRKLSAALTEP
jgi:hypothetical protein